MGSYDDKYNLSSPPPPDKIPNSRASSRKRPQRPSTDSDDYVPNEYQPPPKRQKFSHHECM